MKHNDTDLHQKKAICHVPVIFGTRYRDSISLELETQDITPSALLPDLPAILGP